MGARRGLVIVIDRGVSVLRNDRMQVLPHWFVGKKMRGPGVISGSIAAPRLG